MYRRHGCRVAAHQAFYYGMVSLIDKQVGRLVEVLRALGLLDNTLDRPSPPTMVRCWATNHMVFKGTTYGPA